MGKQKKECIILHPKLVNNTAITGPSPENNPMTP